MNHNDDAAFRFSPSQFKIFRSWDKTGRREGCVGKWAWSYLDALREGDDANKSIGTDTHTHMELWLLYRVQPDADDDSEPAKLANALIASASLPDPEQPGLSVEGDFHYLLDGFSDVFIIGKRDYFVGVPTSVRLEDGTIIHNAVVVGDHKTTANLKYVKSKKILREDAQVGAYTTAAHLACPEARYVVVRWHYVEKESYVVKTVELVFDTQDTSDLTIIHKWAYDFTHDARQMRDLKLMARSLKEDGVDGPYTPALVPLNVLNEGACGAFRGCKHEKRCHKKFSFNEPDIDPDDWKAHVEIEMAKETPAEKLARIKAEKAAAAGASKAAPVTEGKGGAAAKLAAKKAAEPPAESAPAASDDDDDDEVAAAAAALEKAKAAKEAKAKAAAEAAEAAKAPPAPKGAAFTSTPVVGAGHSTELLKAAGKAALEEGDFARSAAISWVLGFKQG